jgi:selenide,water dikinase
VTRIVLLGGGHAHALVLLRFRDFISKNLEVLLVSESAVHTYSGMVPGVIAGHYAPGEAQIDLARLARGAGAQQVAGTVVGVDPAGKRVVLGDGVTISYDVLSLNLGSAPGGATPVKPFEAFIASWRALLESRAQPRVAVLGAGAGGVEIAMAMKFALDRRGGGAVEIFSDRFQFPDALGSRIRSALGRLGVPLHVGEAPGSGFDATYSVTGPAAHPLLRGSGLKTDAQGYVLVDASLRSVSHLDVFAAGDNASISGMQVPKSGVYAVRQGPVLADNLKNVVRGMAMRDFRAQAASLALISCGAKYAIASRGSWSAEGRWAWYWKDWLDRRWIARFS